MVKQCNIILNNSAVTVVKYGDILVQLPAIGKDADSILVAYEGDKYFSVNEGYAEKEVRTETLVQPKKRAAKKTTTDNKSLTDMDVVSKEE